MLVSDGIAALPQAMRMNQAPYGGQQALVATSKPSEVATQRPSSPTMASPPFRLLTNADLSKKERGLSYRCNEFSSDEELSVGKQKSMVLREKPAERGQLEEVTSPSLSPKPVKRSEQEMETVPEKLWVKGRSNEGDEGKLLGCANKGKLAHANENVPFNQAQGRMGLNEVKLIGPITNWVIPISSPNMNNSNSSSPNSLIVSIYATGYGICQEIILIVRGRCRKCFTAFELKYPILASAVEGILAKEIIQLIPDFEVEPHFHLEDKVDFQAAGIDRLPPTSSILEGLRST